MSPARTLLASLAASCAACVPGGVEAAQPRPSDALGDEWAEDDGRERKDWIETQHRAAPGVDWRALERANAARGLRRRNALALAGVRGRGPWSEVGSSNQAGQTRCCALGTERDGERALYLGSGNGGLWRGALGGGAWEPLSDAVAGGVDEVVALDPGSAGRDDVLLFRRGAALYRSVDGGRAWEAPVGTAELSRVRRMLLLGDAAQTVLLLVETRGATSIHASTDLGASFAPRWCAASAWDGDMWVPRRGPGVGRDVYLLHEGRVWRSVDGGARFQEHAALDTSARRGVLSGSGAGGPRLFAALQVGDAWRLQRIEADGSVHPGALLEDFWGTLRGFPSHPNVVLTGGLEARRSIDGGRTFRVVSAWDEYYANPARKLHADVRGVDVLPDPEALVPGDVCFVHTDGGTYVSRDALASVENICLSGLGVGQVYDTLTAAGDATRILAGTQDQGLQEGRLQPPLARGPSTPFEQLISGDYGFLSSASGELDRVVCTYPGFVLVRERGADPELSFVDFPAGEPHLWLPPVLADPTDEGAFFLLTDRLQRYTRAGGGDWSHAPHGAHSFGAPLAALAFARRDPRKAYAAVADGSLWHSDDGAQTWQRALDGGPAAESFHPTVLAVHPRDARHALAGGSGYSGPRVRRTYDGGRTWRDASRGLPRTLVHDLAFATDGSEDVYAATEAGAWRWRADLEVWVDLCGAFAPATVYRSVEAVDDGRVMRFGTYGRGIWDYRVERARGAAWARYGLAAGELALEALSPPGRLAAQLFVGGAQPGASGVVLVARVPSAGVFAAGALLVGRPLEALPFVADAHGECRVVLTLPADGAGRALQALAGTARSNALRLAPGASSSAVEASGPRR
jgi:photosystem II stability/assembly factor-like uncharacterized protein